MLILTVPILPHNTPKEVAAGVRLILPDGRTARLHLRRKKLGDANRVQLMIDAPRDLRFVRDGAVDQEDDTCHSEF